MKKAIISRTIRTTFARCKVFRDSAIFDDYCTLPASCTTGEIAERYIRKHPDILTGKLVVVETLETVEKLVGMYLDTFIENAACVTERTKDTRDCVTKEVKALAATALYMDEQQQVKESTVTIPQGVANIDAFVRKNYKFPGYFITVKDTHEVSALYAMPEKVFVAIARPMKNKFSLE